MLVEILVLSVVVEETLEKKGEKDKEAAEGGDKVGVERKVEEVGEMEKEEESRGDGNEPVTDVDLDSGGTLCSG